LNTMTKMGKIFCLIFILALCCSKESLTKITIGQSFSADGIIKDETLVFRFQPQREKFVKNKDFFNFIYFEGDTLCFSFKLNARIDKKDFAVFFVNPKSGGKYPAERIDIIDGNRVAGFSLIGSILEHFFREQADSPFKTEDFDKAIPFVIRFEPALSSNAPREVNGEFKIELR